jgi:hypothetical protein
MILIFLIAVCLLVSTASVTINTDQFPSTAGWTKTQLVHPYIIFLGSGLSGAMTAETDGSTTYLQVTGDNSAVKFFSTLGYTDVELTVDLAGLNLEWGQLLQYDRCYVEGTAYAFIAFTISSFVLLTLSIHPLFLLVVSNNGGSSYDTTTRVNYVQGDANAHDTSLDWVAGTYSGTSDLDNNQNIAVKLYPSRLSNDDEGCQMKNLVLAGTPFAPTAMPTAMPTAKPTAAPTTGCTVAAYAKCGGMDSHNTPWTGCTTCVEVHAL